MALSTLRRLQLEKNAAARFAAAPEHGARLAAFVRSVEKEIWTSATPYLTAEQAAELRRLSEDWFAANADLEFSSLVHFHEFFAARSGGSLGEVMRGGARGMLGPLREAATSIDEARLVSERALFLSVRLPLLARWQVEALAYRALNLPETRDLLKNATAVSTATSQAAQALQALPAQLSQERQALLAGAQDTTQALAHLLTEARAAIAESAPLVAEARTASEHARTAALDLRAALASVAAIQEIHAKSAFAALTPEQATTALADLRRTAELVREILQSLAPAGDASPSSNATLSQALLATESSARRTIDHAAWRAVQVLATAFVLSVAAAFLWTRLGRQR